MNQDPVTVERLNWQKILPGLHLWRALSLGFRLRVLIPAVLVTAGLVVSPQNLFRSRPIGRGFLPHDIWWPLSRLLQDVTGMQDSGVLPFFVDGLLPLTGFLLCGYGKALPLFVWNLALLSVAGLAIARTTATAFCDDSRTGAGASLRFALSRLPQIGMATLIAVVIVGLFLLPVALASVVSDPSSWGSSIVMLLWLPLAISALLASLAAVICGFGWLLSIAAIGTDQCDAADALSRGISYVLSHKLRAGLYLLFVCALSLAAKVVMALLLSLTFSVLNAWLPAFHRMAHGHTHRISGLAQNVMAGSACFLKLLPDAVQMGTFLAGVTLIYILLRQREDGIDLRERDGGRLRPVASAVAAPPAESSEQADS